MSIKKKMSVGILTGALGLSLIGGGTWAAFNDVEDVSHKLAAGTLDLVVGEDTTLDFTISNLKPGDYFTKQLVLENNGSLPINQIKFHAMKNEATAFVDEDVLGLTTKFGNNAGNNTEDEFLSQFNVKIVKANDSTAVLYDGSLSGLYTTGVEELTGTNDETIGLDVAGTQTYDVTVTFVEDDEKFTNSRLYKQNKYQNEGTDIKFVFEATQMPGEDRSNN
jgi:spore coat-associated protein N